MKRVRLGRTLLQLQGAENLIRSMPAQGRIAMPASRGARLRTPDPVAPVPVGKMRILVADDDHAELIRGAFLRAGFSSVDAASNGRDALAMHSAQPYDLLILNRRMPPIDGPEVLHRLRTDGDDVAVIMTAAGDLDEQDVLSLGIWDIVRKPFAMADLIASAGQALNVERYKRSLTEPGSGGPA